MELLGSLVLTNVLLGVGVALLAWLVLIFTPFAGTEGGGASAAADIRALHKFLDKKIREWEVRDIVEQGRREREQAGS